jgi:hypothetical protein
MVPTPSGAPTEQTSSSAEAATTCSLPCAAKTTCWAGKDIVLGENEVRPLGGEKNLVGGPSNDIVNSGLGSDNVVGNEDNDLLFDGEFDVVVKDNLSGGKGNDVMDPVNVPAGKDVLPCGSGLDRVVVDTKDVVAADCERVKVAHGYLAEILRQDNAFFRTIPESFFEGLP